MVPKVHSKKYSDFDDEDLDISGVVDQSDLVVFATDFSCGAISEGDFDNNGDIDGIDLKVFTSDFGLTDCPAP